MRIHTYIEIQRSIERMERRKRNQKIKQVKTILHDLIKNKAILPWIDHLINELMEKASEETLQVVVNLLGRNVKVLNDIIEVQTGYRSREQYEGENYEDEDEDEE